MNDLAEKALHGLDVARKQVRDHPMLSVSVVGFVLSATVVVAGGRVGAARSTRSLTTWLGLEDSHGVKPGDSYVPGAVMLAGIVGLIALWVLTVEIVRRTRQPSRRVWWVAGAWAVPFAVGPPLLDTSVYTYAAYGLLQRYGHDPYTATPAHLGDVPVVSAIEPAYRGVPSASGPLGSLLQHLSVSVGSGSALGAVLVLRGLGLLAVIWIGRVAADTAGLRSAPALSLCVLNPLLLLYVVSAAHLDGLMIAVLMSALAMATQRRWLSAVALACIAGSISAQAFVAVPLIITVHWLGRRSVAAWRLIGRDVLVAAVTTLVLGLIQPDGFGWIRTVTKQFSMHPPFSVANGIGQLMSPIVRDASYDDLAAGGRITAMAAAAFTIGYLIGTAGQRALERSVGYALLALALLAPVLDPWYVLWGALCLAPAATGPRRIWVLGLCSAACLLTPPGFSQLASRVVTGVALVVAAAIVLGVLVREQRASAREVPDVVSADS